jgi:hypothetical protein
MSKGPNHREDAKRKGMAKKVLSRALEKKGSKEK